MQAVCYEEEWEYEEICIGDIKDLLEEYEIEVLSPDDYVPVNYFIDKGLWEEYILSIDDKNIICNENHLFETDKGWKYAKDLIDKTDVLYLCEEGIFKPGSVTRTGKMVPIVDINVEHENHRYYTNGVSSHNTGKSLSMCNSAAYAIKNGIDCLYITMEMAEEKISQRIDANLFNMAYAEIPKTNKEMFVSTFDKMKQKSYGKLYIKEYGTGGASITQFKALLQDLKVKKNFIPKIIFVDYLNICASARAGKGANSFEKVKCIAEELRSIAMDYNVPVVTATQLNREGISSTDPDMTSASESIGIAFVSDFMAAMVATDEMRANGMIKTIQLKNRFSDPNDKKIHMIGVNYSVMKLYDLQTQPNHIISQNQGTPAANSRSPLASVIDTGIQDLFEEISSMPINNINEDDLPTEQTTIQWG